MARCIRTWGDGGILDHVLIYDQQSRRTIVTDSLGASTTYDRDSVGLVTRVVDPRGKETRYEYDDDLRKTEEIDALGQTTRYRYDKRGNQIAEIGPDGATTKNEYDEHGAPVWLRTPKGGKWRWSYDREGRLLAQVNRRTTQVVHSDGSTERFVYDEDGAQKFEHDARGYLVSTTYPEGWVDVRMPDEVGNLFRTRERGDRDYGAGGELKQMQTADTSRRNDRRERPSGLRR